MIQKLRWYFLKPVHENLTAGALPEPVDVVVIHAVKKGDCVRAVPTIGYEFSKQCVVMGAAGSSSTRLRFWHSHLTVLHFRISSGVGSREGLATGLRFPRRAGKGVVGMDALDHDERPLGAANISVTGCHGLISISLMK